MKDYSLYYNQERYCDPTMGAALNRIMNEKKTRSSAKNTQAWLEIASCMSEKAPLHASGGLGTGLARRVKV